MPNNPTNITNVTPPRVPLTDARTGLISREWYRFFFNLFQLVGQGQNQISLLDVQYGPPQGTANPSDTGNPSIAPDPLPAELLSNYAELQKQVYGLEMGSQPQLGTMAQLQQASVPWLTFATSPQGVPTSVGTVAWDGGSTLGVQATANVIIRVGESEYVYVKASSAITKGQLCYHTGAVGSSGVITAAPTPLALADPNQIVGVAAETIALNDFGLIQISGDLRGFNTTGSSVGETWADGDPLYYNPAYVGSMTKVKPSAPSQKSYIGEVTNAGSGGSGSMHIRIVPGSVLGGTDSNVQFSSLANNDLIQYDSTLQYWKNVAPSSVVIGTATNLAGGAAGSVPYQTAPGTTTFLPIGTAAQVLKVNAGATAPEWVSGAALTKTDDTNVTLTLGGSPTTSLLAATSLTLGWTGQLGLSRGGTNANLTASAGSVVYSTASALAVNTAGSSGDWLKSGGTGAPVWTSPAALTKTNDTNVTLTLGGSPTTALLAATSLTLGWTGQLGETRGGTAQSTYSKGDILYASAANTLAKLPIGANNQILRVATDVPDWEDVSTLAVTSFSAGTTGLTPATATTGAITLGGILSSSNGGTGINNAGRTLTINTNSGTIAFSGASTTMTFPTTSATIARTDAGQTFTGTQTVEAAPTQDAVAIAGRAGGTSSYIATITPTTLSASRTITLPNLSGTVALLSNTQTFSGTTTFSAATVTVGSSTAASTYGLGTGATISGSTKTINIGTAGVSGSTTAINIGSAVSGATTTVTANGVWTYAIPPRSTAPVTKTADFTVADTDLWLINNKVGSSCTVTLPLASSNTGRVLYFQNYQAQTLVSASSNVVPIGGGAAGTSILLASAGDQCTLVSDGTNWIIMQYVPNNILLLE